MNIQWEFYYLSEVTGGVVSDILFNRLLETSMVSLPGVKQLR